VPGYCNVISSPMALSDVRSRLPAYSSFAEFESDVKLMFDNCKEYNKAGDPFYVEVGQLLIFLHFFCIFCIPLRLYRYLKLICIVDGR
jgi:hypothetical protein